MIWLWYLRLPRDPIESRSAELAFFLLPHVHLVFPLRSKAAFSDLVNFTMSTRNAFFTTRLFFKNGRSPAKGPLSPNDPLIQPSRRCGTGDREYATYLGSAGVKIYSYRLVSPLRRSGEMQSRTQAKTDSDNGRIQPIPDA